MGKQFSLLPKRTKRIKTRFRKIVTDIPAPRSIRILRALRNTEPASMTGQPPVVWDHAIGFQVFDRWGNCWLDWSSGVLVASAGHGCPEIIASIAEALRKPLLHNYCFPSEYREKLTAKLLELGPKELSKCFLLTTGAEAVECIIKVSRAHGQKTSREKNVVVTFNGDFHGRTAGAQLAGGSPALKEWIGPTADKGFVQVDFPGDIRTQDKSFEYFIRSLDAQGIFAEKICLVLPETFQGGSAAFLPIQFAKKLREWTRRNDIVLGFDEIQAGLGRCGTLWGFDYYGITPDIFCLGKGISSSLPLSAVIGKPELLDVFPPNSMTSTHSGNPICCAASLANINSILRKNLIGKAANIGQVLHSGLDVIRSNFPENIAAVQGRGMVAGIHMVKPGTKLEPDSDAAFSIVERGMEKGLLMFAPVGHGEATIKIAPPLITPKSAIVEGLTVLKESIQEVVHG